MAHFRPTPAIREALAGSKIRAGTPRRVPDYSKSPTNTLPQIAFRYALYDLAEQGRSRKIPARFELTGLEPPYRDGLHYLDAGAIGMASDMLEPLEKDSDGFVREITLKSSLWEQVVEPRLNPPQSAPTMTVPGDADTTQGTPTEKASDQQAENERALRRLERLILDRSGQSAFRKQVFAAYEGRCAITGATSPVALEAAHIRPFHENGNDDPRNGLLLRADLHALFDAKLLSFNPETGGVELAPEILADPVYSELQTKRLRERVEGHPPPLMDAIREHYEAFRKART